MKRPAVALLVTTLGATACGTYRAVGKPADENRALSDAGPCDPPEGDTACPDTTGDTGDSED